MQRKTKSNNYCCVPQCSSYYDGIISMHGFPIKNEKLVKSWQIRLKIDKPITSTMKVCSKHFEKKDYILPDHLNKRRRLKTAAIPSENLPAGSTDKQHLIKIKKHAAQSRASRAKKRTLAKSKIEQAPIMVEPNENDLEAANILLQLSEVQGQETEVPENTNLPFLEEKAVQVNAYTEFGKFSISEIINNEYRIKFCTGINNLTLFNVIIETSSSLDKSTKNFSTQNKVLLTLMKIKLGLTFRFLAILFDTSETSARRFFISTCKILSFILKATIRFPSKEEVVANMPLCFNKYKKTRIILDCTEIFIEKSKCLKCRLRSYSYYKGNHTCKFLIGVAPSGLITFVSKAYGGRASDKAIFNEEGLIKKFIPGQDAIMVDKGFLIESECAENFLELIRPPFLGKNREQFSKEEAEKTADIARARVHVERTIQRLKNFALLRNKISFSLLPHIDHIVNIVTGLVNLSEPILGNTRF